MDEIKRWDVLKLDWVEYGMATIAIKFGYNWNERGAMIEINSNSSG